MERILSVLQEDQQWGTAYMNLDTYAQEMVDAGEGFAMVDGEEVIGCAGVSRLDMCRAQSWALISENIGPMRYFQYHKAVRDFLDNCDWQRVEMAVAEMHVEAHRWAHMLGFKPEGLMKKYFPDGGSATLWARIK